MKKIIFNIFSILSIKIPTFFNCVSSGLKFDSSWNMTGKPIIIRRKWYEKMFAGHGGGRLKIGKNFTCNNTISSNSIGLIQPCVFDIAIDNSVIEIGDNVGISGSTINAACYIRIENNVAIGSGCIITDTDSHPIGYEDRINNNNWKTRTAPVIIKEGAFIGARCLIMKGVSIGRHSVIGAGSVVTKSIPDDCIACGNPAKVIKYL